MTPSRAALAIKAALDAYRQAIGTRNERAAIDRLKAAVRRAKLNKKPSKGKP